jgi:predicted nucleotidyltransferase
MKKKKYTISKSQKVRIADNISSYLEENLEGITTAYLFGSFVTDAKNDLAKAIFFEFELENRLEKIFKHTVDVRILNRAPLSFCQNVIRRGKVILDRDPNLRADFEGNILKQYFDYSRFRKQYLKEAVNAPI